MFFLDFIPDSHLGGAGIGTSWNVACRLVSFGTLRAKCLRHDMAGTPADGRTGHGGRRTPPYVGFRPFIDLIAYLKKSGCPERIEHATGDSHLITALGFLDLVDATHRPTAMLKDLTAAHGTENWRKELEQMLRRSYAPLFERDLTSIIPGDFHRSFSATYPASGEVTRKCTAFFLHAAREADVALNGALMVNRKPRHAPSLPRHPKGPSLASSDRSSGAHLHAQAKLHVFVEIFNVKALNRDELAAFEILLAYLQAQAKI